MRKSRAKFTRTRPLVFFVFLAFSAPAIFAQADGWTLLHEIKPGQRVHVHTRTRHAQSGGFISVSDAGIVVRQRTGDQNFSKDEIEKISVRKTSRRWRNAAIGAAAGAAIGIALGNPFAHEDGVGPLGIGCLCGPRAAAVFGGFLGILGGGIGASFPGYKTVYRVP